MISHFIISSDLLFIPDINIDNGLYLGIKNSYIENQNIFISGISTEDNKIIKWEITKI